MSPLAPPGRIFAGAILALSGLVSSPALAQDGCTSVAEDTSVCRGLIPESLAMPPPLFWYDASSVKHTCPAAAGFTSAERAAPVVVPFDAEVKVSFCHGYAAQQGTLSLTSIDPDVVIGTSTSGDQLKLDDVTIGMSLGEFAAGDTLTLTYTTVFLGTTYDWDSGTENVGARVIGDTVILGYEDQPFATSDEDSNDVFAVVQFTRAACTDTDTDGWCDDEDNCPDVANALQTDTDADGAGDACDACTDIDGDGVCDELDNCPGTYNPDQVDTDVDGLGDACDDCLDVDVDEFCDDADTCPGTYDPDQADSDGDGLGDACDDCLDTDWDGVCDDVDNCLELYNPLQVDVDIDGIGDDCDGCVDVDDDGACDIDDNCPTVANADQADSDKDGAGDACDPDACVDADDDGICDNDDACTGTILPDTVPTVALKPWRWADLDGDGVFDTVTSSGKGPGRSYTIEDTMGCSCAQIIAALDLGSGHTMHGCSISAMDAWVLGLEH